MAAVGVDERPVLQVRVSVAREDAEDETLAEGAQLLGREIAQEGSDMLVATAVDSVVGWAIEHLAKVFDMNAISSRTAIEALDEENRLLVGGDLLR